MAWYAKVENNIVTDVLYLVDTKDSDWLYREYGGTWLRCAEDGSIRQCFPSIGYNYDSQTDAFTPPKPFASWLYNQTTHQWYAPVTYPTDGKRYLWDETTTSWVEVTV
jgi:hypothetical protein